MKAYAPLIAGDIAITQGWDNFDDGHGAYWNIQVKHKNKIPDGENVISLDNGMVAERNSSLISADELLEALMVTQLKLSIIKVNTQFHECFPVKCDWY